MIELEPDEILGIVAALGALWYMVQGYLTNKIENPNEKFNPEYITRTLVTCLLMGLAFWGAGFNEINVFTVGFALLSGMGGNSAVSKIERISTDFIKTNWK